MFYNKQFYTVESVTAGHPDKICDQISDAILDACLKEDPNSRVAVESFGGHGLLVICGEIRTSAKPDYESIGRNLYRSLGYEENLRVITNVVEQSPDIAQGVDVGGAGDQGIMYGFATNETPEFLPKGIVLVHELTKGLQNLRVTGKIKWLKPDGKAQITMKDGHVKTVLISTQHDAKISQDEIKEALKNELVLPLLSARGEVNEGVEILVNPTGIFVKGGFEADTGLTGRKIMVDTYGGLIAHGGGCFSGKDATKVDRSAAYMARFAAKNLVANGLAKECMVSVAYAIGKAEPLMVSAKNENGGDLGDVVNKNFNFQPGEIIRRLGLKQPIYLKTAAYGHFGKPDLPWEKIEKV